VVSTGRKVSFNESLESPDSNLKLKKTTVLSGNFLPKGRDRAKSENEEHKLTNKKDFVSLAADMISEEKEEVEDELNQKCSSGDA